MILEPWVHRPLFKLMFLWLPAATLLGWLKFRKIRSVIIYFISLANLVSYLLWLGAMLIVTSPSFHHWSLESKGDLRVVLSVIPPLMFFAIPFAAAVGSFILLITSFIAKPGELAFLVPANLLAFVLWGFSMIAPN
jgi:hypothetical protein